MKGYYVADGYMGYVNGDYQLFADEPTELERSGLDPDELEWMSGADRRAALEDAGLDPEEYDF